MRIVFAGTPDFAQVHLKTLIEKGFDVVGVFTQPDRPKGRGHKLTPSPVKETALSANIEVFQPLSFKKEPEFIETLRNLKPDLLVVVAYGLLLPQEVLDIPTFGAINVHGSLLPKWRGAAPIQRALWNGDKETGVTIMKIGLKLDAGDMLLKKVLPITDTDTSETLYEKLSVLGCEGLVEVINNLESYYQNAQVQDESLVTYAAKLTKEEALLDFSLNYDVLDKYIRAFNPWPLAYFYLDEQMVKVYKAKVIKKENKGFNLGEIVSASKEGLEIAVGNGSLIITNMQLPNKKAMEFNDIFNSKADLFVPHKNLTFKPQF